MKQELETVGKNLWEDLEKTLSESKVEVSGVFDPDFCDLQEELKKTESEPLDEVVQHLRDLGYLESPLDENKNEIALGPQDAESLTKALNAYYTDQDSFEELLQYQPTHGESGQPKNVFRDKVLENRLKQPLVVKFDTIARLRALLTLDGKFEFFSEPETGETSLRTRVLHHLLRVYGVLPNTFKPGTAYRERSLRALRGLRSLRGVKADEKPLLRVMNDLNHFDVMAEAFAKQFDKASVWIPEPKSKTDWDDSLKKQRKAIKESQAPIRVVDVKAFETNDNADWPPPSWNLFGIRFLQVYLWHRGHYFGVIDGLWGPVSQAAYISALEAHALPVKPLKKWQEKNTKGYWMVKNDFYCLDVSAFVKATTSPLTATENAKSPDDLFEMQEAIDIRLTQLGATNNERRDAWSKVFSEATGDKDWKQGRRRRNFSLGMVGRGIQRMLDVVKGAWETLQAFVKAVVETIRGAVRQAVRFLQRILAPALHTAKLAARRVIRMFTGAPYVHATSETRWVLTKFSFDLDAVTLGSSELLPKDVAAHFALIQEENRALDIVVRLGMMVLKIASAFTPPLTGIAAVNLAWDVLKAVWQLFRKLQAPFKKESAPWRTGMLMTT